MPVCNIGEVCSMQARVDEVIEAALSSEREATILRLSEALAAREAELRGLQRYAPCSLFPLTICR